jgi:CHAD domain-containing protein
MAIMGTAKAVLYIMPPSRYRYDLLRKRLFVFTRMLPGVEKGDARALHRLRVASRRLRELLPILQLDNDVTRKLGRRLRRMTARLGAVRELDVLVFLLDELHESSRYHEGGLSRVAAAVAHDRDEARKKLDTKLPATELRRMSDKLEHLAEDLNMAPGASTRREEAAWRWAVDARIARRADRLLRAMREAGAVYLPERLHSVRIAVKKFRYAFELAADIEGDNKRKADLRTLKHTQDVLGRMHDLQVLIDRVRQIQAATAADIRAERELEAIVETLENDCRRLHARYVRERTALSGMCTRSLARVPAAPVRRAAPRRVAS